MIARTLRWVTLLAATLVTTAAWADPPRAPASAPTATTAAARASARPAAEAPASEGVVNINTATAEELVRVPGIGRVGFRRMRPYLALTGETTLASRPGRAARARPLAATE